jgi:HAD superfamily phosphoserine phosphatase-like hydrolase
MDKPKYIVFDFDHTLYAGDCTIDMAWFTYKNFPAKIPYIIIQVFAFIAWKLSFLSTTTFKQLFLGYLNGLSKTQVDELIHEFWKTAHWNKELVSTLHQKQQLGFTCVIITASPEWFVKPIAQQLFKTEIIGTQTNFEHHKITLVGENCKGLQKVKRFEEAFGADAELAEAYSDNASDTHLFKRAQKAYKVVGKKIIPQQ